MEFVVVFWSYPRNQILKTNRLRKCHQRLTLMLVNRPINEVKSINQLWTCVKVNRVVVRIANPVLERLSL